MRAGVWSGIVVMVVLVLAASWFLSTYERVPVSEQMPPTARARQDDFLAAKRWLKQMQIPSRAIEGLEADFALRAGSVLVLPATRNELSAAAQARLLAAVASGAHLLVQPKDPQRRDALLMALGVERKTDPDADQDHGLPSSTDWRLRRSNFFVEPLLRVEFDERVPVYARLRASARLARTQGSLWSAARGERTQILHFSHGEGRVTVITDLRFLRNWGLARFDHAELFWRLLNLPEPAREVIFLSDSSPGLGRWLIEHAWRVLLALALLIGAWLWAHGVRFGPILPDPETNRRRLLDHLRASGRLLWSLDARAPLAQAARTAALDRVQREYPHLRLLSAADQQAFVQRRCGLSAADVGRIFTGEAAATPAAFLGLIRACRQLHLALSHRAGERHDPLYENP